MKAILILRTGKLLEALRPTVEAEGYEIARAVVRKPGQPLHALLGAATGIDLVVVDSSADKMDLAALEEVTGANPEMAVVMLSPSRDSDVLLGAMHAGVREVLMSPPADRELTAALRRLAQRRPSGQARVVAFMASKGGSGATFIATNTAYMLATEQNFNTVLVDLDLQYGDASYFVTDGPAKSTLADLTSQVDRLDANLLAASMLRIAPKFSLLAAPEEPEAALGITASQLESVLDVAARNCEMLVMDVERMVDAVTVKALDRADLVFLVLQNMLPYVRDTRRLVRTLRGLGYPDAKLRLIVNRYDPHGAVSLAQIERAVGLKVAHTLPDRPGEVNEAINTGVPLVKVHRDGAIARHLREIVTTLSGKPAAQPTWIGRLIGEQD